MTATVLSAGDVAVVGYNTGQTDVNGTTLDSIQIVLLRPIGSGTVFFITDRGWTGSAFSGTNDGTITYTAGADLPIGTVINVPIAGGFNPEQAGDAIYLYQGSDANTPTTFLFAVEIADGNTTFSGSLTNTGLVAGTNAVGISLDSATYSGPTTEAFAQIYNSQSLLKNIADASNWVGDDADAGPINAIDQPNPTGPYTLAADFSLWAGASAGGNGLVSVGGDASVSGGNTGFSANQLFTNFLVGGVSLLFHPSDLVFDTVHGKFFLIDSDIGGGHNRVLQGNISDLLGNPSTQPTLTVLYSDPGTTTASRIDNIDVDPNNGIVYFTHGMTFQKVVYDTAGQTPVTLANFGAASGNPNGTTSNFMDDFVIDYAGGNVYLSSHRVVAGQDGDQVSRNYIYKITGLSSGSGAGAFTFGGGQITVLPFSPDDDDVNNGVTYAAGEGFPQENGSVEGLALSNNGQTLYISTASTLYDHDADGGFAGDGLPATTDPLLKMGGIYSYSLTGNATGVFTNIYQPTDDGDTNSQTIQTAFGPQGLLDDLEIDPITGDLFFLDTTGDQLGATNPAGDEGIWRIDTDGTADPTFFQGFNNINGLGATSLFFNHAPTVTSSTQGTPTVTEASSAPNSGSTALVQPFISLNVTDAESADQTHQLAGAVVRISNNFQSGATHADTLTINGLASGTLGTGISFSYTAATGVMVLSGASTFDNYEAAIALVRFNTSGDNVTNYGAATTRTISWSVSDGLNHSDEVSASVTVVGVNDAPVNTTGAAGAAVEDSANNALTGISVFDVDANPATQDIRVTLSVAHGTITIRTDVANGIVVGDITAGANNSSTITITATQDQINATLANATGLVYTPTANFNGSDALTIVTNDLGLNGLDAGLSGDGTSEQDSDTKTINVSAVNDAPVVAGDGTEDAATIYEDLPSAGGQMVSSLFGSQFTDVTDNQMAFSGSWADTLAGIAVIANGSSGATGQWQFFNGASWTDIGAASAAAAQLITASTLIRFNPALNFNGAAPTLTARLVDSSGAAFANGADVDLTSAFGGTTRYSTGTVVLSQAVTPLNDAPASTLLQGDSVTYNEGSAPVMLDLGSNATIADVDSANFNGGTLTVSIFSGVVAAEDQLGIDTSGTVTVAAGTVSVSAVAIGTYTGGGAGGSNLVFTLNANATPAAVQALVRALTYSNSETENPTGGARTITLTLVDGDGNDGGLGADTLTVTSSVTVVPVNDAPEGVDNGATLFEDATYVFTTADFATGFADVDGNTFAGIKVATLAGSGTLMYDADGAGGAAATAVLANAVISAADISSGKLTFVPAANANGTPYTTFTFAVQDNGGVANGGLEFDQSPNTFTLNVASVNDAPALDLDNVAGGTGVAAAYTEAAPATPIAPAATVTDADSADFAGGTLTVSFTANGTAADQLTVKHVGTGAGQIGVSGANISYAGTTIGSFTGGANGGDLVITLNASATAAAVQDLVRNVSFSNTSGAPSTLTRSVGFTLVDGDGTANSGSDTGSATATIAVTSINSAPTGGVSITGTATEDQVLTAVSTLADDEGLGTLHYQWQHDIGGGFVNVGTDQSTYTLGDTDVGGIVRVVVSYTDLGGAAESATSASTAAIANVNDAPTGGVSITGTATEDQVLTADASALADIDGLGTLHYQWQRNTGSGFTNVGTDQATYTLGDADVGGTVRVVTTYTDQQGTAESVTSAATAAIGGTNDAPTGGASVTGTATEDQVLTAVSTLADADGLGTLHYQWQHDVGSGFVNVGTDQSTYTLGDGDVGGVVRVVISYTDGQGFANTATSPSTAAIANVNDVPTGGAAITGTAAEDQVLTAVSTLADIDGLGTLHYQWQRDVGAGFVNVGADQSTYTLGDADIGGVVRVIISYTDGQGTAESATSTATAAITATNDAPTGGVSITGTATEDQVLTAVSTVADSDGLGTLHYQWQHDVGSGFVDIAAAADQATYTLGDADVGGVVRVVVSYTDGQGFANSVTSAATAAISNVNDPHTGGAGITGTATEDQVLTAVSTMADADGLGTLHYQWQHDVGSGYVNIVGSADQSTYTLGDADVGGLVRVVISYTDVHGTAESSTSASTAAIANVNDDPAGGVSVTGTTTEDQVLTADTSALLDDDGLGTLHYQWQRNSGSGFVNVGTDQATYALGDADVGGLIRVVTSYVDQQGTAEAVTSAATAAISAINDPHTGGAAVTGTATEDQVLTAASTLADVDGLGTFHYQWQHDVGSGYVNIAAAADQSTYTLGDADVGGLVRVVISYTDGQGFAESSTSSSTAAIAGVNDALTGSVSITGTATEDQVLTADTSTLADVDGLGTLHYQWQRDTGSGFVNVGTDQATYTLADADVGGTVRVVTSYTDGQGFAESSTSAATAAIAAVNDAPTGGVSITGTATEDQVLTAVSTLADADGLGTFHYQWQRDAGAGYVDIAGAADQSTYTLGDADVSNLIRVVVSYTDGQGFANTATSSSTAAIANVNDAPAGALNITGSATVGSMLAVANTVTDADGLGAFAYQWFREGVAIVDAVGATYNVQSADVAQHLTVTGTYTDGFGTVESMTSAAVLGAELPPEGVTIIAPPGGGVLIGTPYDDTLIGQGGRDIFFPNGGQDTLTGGDNIDTAVFAGKRKDYSVTREEDGSITVQSLTDPNTVARLEDIERLKFSDKLFAMDTTDVSVGIARMYMAALQRNPDDGGLEYYIDALANGVSEWQLALNFVSSPEFTSIYGATDDEAFVTKFYRDILHREPDAGGMAYWLDVMASLPSNDDRAMVVVGFSFSPEMQLNLVGLMENGIELLV